MTYTQLIRLSEVETRYGAKRTTIEKHIAEGTFVPAIKLGKNTRWPADEVEAVVRARIAGRSDPELRALVRKLIADRQGAAA